MWFEVRSTWYITLPVVVDNKVVDAAVDVMTVVISVKDIHMIVSSKHKNTLNKKNTH